MICRINDSDEIEDDAPELHVKVPERAVRHFARGQPQEHFF